MTVAGIVRAGRRHRRVDGAGVVGPGLRRRRVQPRPPPPADAPARVPDPRRPGRRPRRLRVLAGDADGRQERRRGGLHRGRRADPGRRRRSWPARAASARASSSPRSWSAASSCSRRARSAPSAARATSTLTRGRAPNTETVANVADVAAKVTLDNGTPHTRRDQPGPVAARQHHVHQHRRAAAPARRRGRGPARLERSAQRQQAHLRHGASPRTARPCSSPSRSTCPASYSFFTEAEDGTDRVEGTIVVA